MSALTALLVKVRTWLLASRHRVTGGARASARWIDARYTDLYVVMWTRLGFRGLPVLRGSLRRLAYRQLYGPLPVRIVRRDLPRWRRQFSFALFAIPYVVAIAPLWLPLKWAWPSLKPQELTALLGLEWGVEATAAALTVAVILFVLTSAAASTPAGTLIEFVSDSYLLVFVDIVVASLVGDFLVLSGAGNGAPAGWAGTWAAAFSAISIASVAGAAHGGASAIQPGRILRRRLKRVSRAVEEAVQREAVERVALNALYALCQERNLTFSIMGERPPAGWFTVLSSRTRVVHDVSISRLRRVKVAADIPEVDRPIVYGRPYLRVMAGSVLFAAPTASNRQRRLAASSFRLRRSRQS